MKSTELYRAESVVTFEVERGFQAGCVVYRSTLSVRGREGTVQRLWRVGESGLTEGQYQDLAHWVLASVAAAIAPVDGVAQSLPL